MVQYEDAITLQSSYAAARKEDLVPDTLLLLEHPHVFTVSKRANRVGGETQRYILVGTRELNKLGVEVHKTDRGGLVTYHGPGQLVAYPILKLPPSRRDVRCYLRQLEEVIIRTLLDFGIAGHRVEGQTGVWVQNEKIASIGVHFSRWVTTHGLALNVNTDLSFFDLIVPCGLRGIRMTSMEKVLGKSVQMRAVEDSLTRNFAHVFESTMIEQPIDRESVQVVIRLTQVPPPPNGPYLLLKRKQSRGDYWQPVSGFIEEGESPREAAHREVEEETGIPSAPGGSQQAESWPGATLVDLSYVHSFAIDPELLEIPSPIPVVVREHSFALLLKTCDHPIRLDPEEHDDYAFVDFSRAISMVRWKGNRRALELTEEAIRHGEDESSRICLDERFVISSGRSSPTS